MGFLLYAATRFWAMVDDLNRMKEPDERISLSPMDPFKFVRIVTDHQSRFPESQLRAKYGTAITVGFLLCIASIFALAYHQVAGY
jgi:hypothetical protein